jgi:SAM-dependent methyltransferase
MSNFMSGPPAGQRLASFARHRYGGRDRFGEQGRDFVTDRKTDAAKRDLKGIQSADADALAGFYDDWAPSYDAELQELGYEAPVRVAALLKTHGVPVTGPILDACCGTGLAGRALRDAGFDHLVGFDISPVSLDEAKAQSAYERVFRQDMNAPLDLGDDTFEAVLCVGSMTYAAEPETLLREFCRVARPNGIVLFTQRTDYWTDEFAAILDRLEAEGLWKVQEVTEPQPYLPEHPDFGDAVKVIYAVYRVA